jgi:hypothetical protein
VGLGIAPRANDLVIYPAVLCVPVAVGVAVLRYRLWDLDRIISRTVTYTLVSGLLVLPYLLIVLTISRLAQGADGLAASPPNCSPWSSRQSSRPAPRYGCAHQPTHRHRASGSHRQDHAGMVRVPSLLPGRGVAQRGLAGQWGCRRGT